MPWCPRCRSLSPAGPNVCGECGRSLVDGQPSAVANDSPVVVLEAATAEEAQIAASTLAAEGIGAQVAAPYSLNVNPNIGVIGDDAPELHVVVPASDVERAIAVLSAPPPSDAELEAIEQQTPPLEQETE